MEAQSLVSHQHSWWFSCFSLREKLARSHNKNRDSSESLFFIYLSSTYTSLSPQVNLT